MPDLPTGTVTLLFTDIAGSTQILQWLGPRYGEVLAEYRALLRATFEQHGGHEVDTQGDSFFVAFPRATDAVQAAVAIQRALVAHAWPEGITMATRMGLHTGEPQRGSDGYIGLDVHRAARIGATGHGGQVLLSDATRGIVAHDLPAHVDLRDLGEHRLKDLRHPRRLWQLVIVDLPSDFPPLKTLDTCPNNLPPQLTSFVGREQEVAALCARLRDPQVRMLTLTAPGGSGKTRLAIQVAAHLLDAFADGVWFVDLAPISDSDPTLVPSTMATTLGVKEVGGQPLVDRLLTFLRDKHLLLVLDNFEQVVAGAGVVEMLLRAAPRLKVLVTSRVVLGLSGEHAVQLSPLTLPDRNHLPPIELLMRFDAVRLFLERAQAAKADFALTPMNAEAVLEICHRLDGLPLAIELAAVRTRLLPARALLDRLSSRLQVLTGGARTVPARQQTLRATIDWSYRLLDADEQALFRRLGVFVGGWTLEAAEEVCNATADLGLDVFDGIQSLLDKSLLRQAEGSEATPRFTLLETIREYALEQLAAVAEQDALRERHASYYLALVEADPPPQGWIEDLKVEHDNVRAALQWLLRSGTSTSEAEQALRLTVRMAEFWRFWLPAEGLRWLPTSLKAAQDGPRTLRRQALSSLGWIACDKGDWAQALPAFEEAFVLARQDDDVAALGDALRGLANVAILQGNDSQAQTCFEESLALTRAMSDTVGLVFTLWGLATITFRQADYELAGARAAEALQISYSLGNAGFIGNSLHVLGRVAHRQGDDARAMKLYQESMAAWQVSGVTWRMAELLEAMAGSATGIQAPRRAARLFGAAEAARRGDPNQAVSVYHQNDYEQDLAAARSQVDEVAWAAAWAEGQAMTLEQAIAYALEKQEVASLHDAER